MHADFEAKPETWPPRPAKSDASIGMTINGQTFPEIFQLLDPDEPGACVAPPKELRKAFSGQVLSAVPGRKPRKGDYPSRGRGCGDRKRRAFAEWSYIRKTLAQEHFWLPVIDDAEVGSISSEVLCHGVSVHDLRGIKNSVHRIFMAVKRLAVGREH